MLMVSIAQHACQCNDVSLISCNDAEAEQKLAVPNARVRHVKQESSGTRRSSIRNVTVCLSSLDLPSLLKLPGFTCVLLHKEPTVDGAAAVQVTAGAAGVGTSMRRTILRHVAI